MAMFQLQRYAVANRALPQRHLPSAALTAVLQAVGNADRSMARQDVPGAHSSLLSAQSILLVLRGSLNRSAAPELVDQLDQLYDFLVRELGQANLEKSRARLLPLVPVITTLRDAFSAAAAQAPITESSVPVVQGGILG